MAIKLKKCEPKNLLTECSQFVALVSTCYETKIKKSKRIKWVKLWGCPECGSEFRDCEIKELKGECRFCTYRGNLEYLGVFNSKSLYPTL